MIKGDTRMFISMFRFEKSGYEYARNTLRVLEKDPNVCPESAKIALIDDPNDAQLTHRPLVKRGDESTWYLRYQNMSFRNQP